VNCRALADPKSLARRGLSLLQPSQSSQNQEPILLQFSALNERKIAKSLIDPDAQCEVGLALVLRNRS
jgi:hypothetical protein